MDPRAPVLVGVGQVVNRDGEVLEPLALMERSARLAAEDAGLRLGRVQAVAVVDAISQALADPGAVLAQRLGITPAETTRSGIGGNGPQLLVNQLATRIAAGELDVALLAGAEAMATLSRFMKQGEAVPWRSESVPAERPGSSETENAAGLIAPIFFYPLLEHALRGAAGRDRDEHLRHISALWAGFADVAADNPHAWSRDRHSADEIATESDGNRKVSDPYLKLHNSHIGVDMGAALILCSAEAAQAAGLPRDRWVYLHAGAHGNDHWFVSERPELHRSEALRLAGEALATEPDHVDLYSCFPSAVQIAARELGLALDRPLTVTGGLTFAGGPGNNYATHGIATLAERLREDPDSVGLATALGWYVTKHALGVYSCREPERPYVAHHIDVSDRPRVEVATAGEGAVESYTALYERDGRPGMGIVAARLGDGRRVVAKTHDPAVLDDLLGDDPLGRTVSVTASDAFQLK
jgi:acetyl-CoA C-acetyltransferase